MADFCLTCCKERHTELKCVSEKRFVVSKYTSLCSSCGQLRPITLGIKPKRKVNLTINYGIRHLN